MNSNHAIMNGVLTKDTLERLKGLNVAVVYLFGSHAEGVEHKGSDIDIGVVFSNRALPEKNTTPTYNSLYDVFTDIFPDRHIDIVFLQNAGLKIAHDAISHGHLLYAESADARYAFEEHVTIMYADFKPILREFDDAVLNRIPG